MRYNNFLVLIRSVLNLPYFTLTILAIFMNFEIIKRLLPLKNKTIQRYELYENLLTVFSNGDY